VLLSLVEAGMSRRAGLRLVSEDAIKRLETPQAAISRQPQRLCLKSAARLNTSHKGREA